MFLYTRCSHIWKPRTAAPITLEIRSRECTRCGHIEYAHTIWKDKPPRTERWGETDETQF